LVVGGVTAAAQVVRGVVRGAGRLIEGEPRSALAEAAAGLVAPVMAAYSQLCRLGEDVGRSAGGLLAEAREEGREAPNRPAAPRRRRAPAAAPAATPAAANGVA
jgi:hypothetical protein